MQYTPQQMMGYATFKSATRIGNWNEDVALQEEKQRVIKSSKNTGGLMVQQMHQKFSQHTSPETIEKQGESVGFFKQCMIFNEDTKGFLAADLDMVIDGTRELYGVTTVGAPKPIARNVFVLEPVQNDKTYSFFAKEGEEDLLHYGQPFRIRVCDSLSQRPLYLRSEMVSSSSCAPVSNDRQEVSLTPHVNYSSVWKIVYRDDKWRYEWENEIVHSNHPCLIQHCSTGELLNSDHTKRVANDFGTEFEVSCKRVCDTHKVEKDENVWYVVVGQGGRAKKNPPISTKEENAIEPDQRLKGTTRFDYTKP